MKITEQQKLNILLRAKSSSPQAAVMEAVNLMFEQIDSLVQEKLSELIPKIVTQVSEIKNTDIIEKMTRNLLADIKGSDGKSVDADEVAHALMDMPEFCEMCEGEDGKTPTPEEILKLIKPLIPKLRQPEDGKTPTKKELLKLIKPLIPKVENGKSPTKEELISIITPILEKIKKEFDIEPKIIASKLNTLENAVELKVVNGLPVYLKNLERMFKENRGDKRIGGGGMSLVASTGITIVRQSGGRYLIASTATGGTNFETPTGTINGSNVTFTVTETPKYIVLNGVLYFENDGYTLSGLTVTMLVVPQTGSTLRSAY